MKCINCGEEVNSAYCPSCGQKNPPKKLNLLTLYGDFQARIYGFDGMFPRTLTDLTVRPGQATKAYIEGNRVRYYGPVGYFFLMITVYLLLASILNIDLVTFTKASMPDFGASQSEGQQQLYDFMMKTMNDSLRISSFIMALLIGFFSWLFFRKSGYNFIENAILIFYVNGHILWLSILSLITYKAAAWTVDYNLQLLITIVFTVYAFVDFYRHQNRVKVILKGLLVFATSYLFLILIAIGMMIVYLINNPDELEKMKPSQGRVKTEQTK
jgi:hypothetical protein